jgi:hypothetical protein
LSREARQPFPRRGSRPSGETSIQTRRA